jgi:hypothetical protein
MTVSELRYMQRERGDLEIFTTEVNGVTWQQNSGITPFMDVYVNHDPIKALRIERYLRLRNGDSITA